MKNKPVAQEARTAGSIWAFFHWVITGIYAIRFRKLILGRLETMLRYKALGPPRLVESMIAMATIRPS